jgi:hypothetical protein
MSIEIRITIPDEDIYKPDAVQKRMLLLGYTPSLYLSAAALMNSDNAPVEHQMAQAEPVVAREDDPSQQARIDASHAKAEVKKTRAKKAEPAPNISAAPEARVDPQDEADEAAEVAVSEAVTAEDLRSVMGAYAAKFGMPATLEDGTAIFTGALGPAPESGWKLSVVAGMGGETLAKAVAGWFAAAASEARYGT